MEANQVARDGCMLDNHTSKADSRTGVRFGVQSGKILLTQGCATAIEGVLEGHDQDYGKEKDKEINNGKGEAITQVHGFE